MVANAATGGLDAWQTHGQLFSRAITARHLRHTLVIVSILPASTVHCRRLASASPVCAGCTIIDIDFGRRRTCPFTVSLIDMYLVGVHFIDVHVVGEFYNFDVALTCPYLAPYCEGYGAG